MLDRIGGGLFMLFGFAVVAALAVLVIAMTAEWLGGGRHNRPTSWGWVFALGFWVLLLTASWFMGGLLEF